MKALQKAALISAALMLYSTDTAAQLTNQGMLDQVVTEFSTRAAGWQSVVMDAAMRLFWSLGTISLVWTGGMMVLRKADIGEFFAEFTRFILFFGFFLWLLRNGPTFASSIIQSLQRLGEQASGVSTISPSGIVDIGFVIWKQAVSNLSVWSPIDSFVGAVLSISILILLAVIAINMLLLLVSAWILMYAGIFFLGFGGSRWTSDMAINYYKTVLGVAIQLFTMVLLIGIGNDLISTFYGRMSKGTLNFEELGVMLVFCVALLMLVNRVPSLLSSVITGGGVGGVGGIGNFGAGAVMSAGAVAGMAVTTGGAGIAAGMANMAGGTQALMAAVAKASQSVAAGTDIVSSIAGGMGSFGNNDRSSDSSESYSPFADAMDEAESVSTPLFRSTSGGFSLPSASKDGDSSNAGSQRKGSTTGQQPQGGMKNALATAGKIAADATTNLAKGGWDVSKAKTRAGVESAQERICQTLGGQIATAIKAQGTTTPASQEPAFDANSLADANDQSVDAEAEIAAFRDRTHNFS